MKTSNATSFRAFACIAALALVPIIPYAIWGYAGQDFEFHVTSWMELRNAWVAGNFGPGWAAMANFTLGDPHLALYPPVSLLLGGLLSLVLPFHLVPAAFMWIALTLAGVSMYVASKPFVAEEDRLAAALLYMLSPYLVTTSLVRFAAAELLVQAWLPFIFLYVYQAVCEGSRRAVLLLGVFLGLSWMTNIPASLVLFYALLAVVGLCAWEWRSAKPVRRLLTAELIAGLLAAFYLLPVWVERRWINQGGLIRANTHQLLLFMRHAGGAPESLKVFKFTCWLFACTGALYIAICLWRRTKQLHQDSATRLWVYFVLVSLFFQLPLSMLLWDHLPQLSAAEFPFRFLPLMGAALPLVLLAPGTRRSLRKLIYIGMALATLLPFAEHIRVQTTASTRSPSFAALDQRWQTEGYEGLAEYWPAGVHARPAAATLGGDCNVQSVTATPQGKSIALGSLSPCQLRLPLLSYPYWQAFDESGNQLTTATDSNGLMLVSVPAGKHRVSVEFLIGTATRRIGTAISLIALIMLLWIWLPVRPEARLEATAS